MIEYYNGVPYPEDKDCPKGKFCVVATCTGEHILEEEVEVEKIGKDDFGRDVVIYICPACGDTHDSLRYRNAG